MVEITLWIRSVVYYRIAVLRPPRDHGCFHHRAWSHGSMAILMGPLSVPGESLLRDSLVRLVDKRTAFTDLSDGIGLRDYAHEVKVRRQVHPIT